MIPKEDTQGATSPSPSSSTGTPPAPSHTFKSDTNQVIVSPNHPTNEQEFNAIISNPDNAPVVEKVTVLPSTTPTVVVPAVKPIITTHEYREKEPESKTDYYAKRDDALKRSTSTYGAYGLVGEPVKRNGKWYSKDSLGHWVEYGKEMKPVDDLPDEKPVKFEDIDSVTFEESPTGVRIMNPFTGMVEVGVSKNGNWIPKSLANERKSREIESIINDATNIVGTNYEPFKMSVPVTDNYGKLKNKDAWVLDYDTPVIFEAGDKSYDLAVGPTGKKLNEWGGYDPERGVFVTHINFNNSDVDTLGEVMVGKSSYAGLDLDLKYYYGESRLDEFNKNAVKTDSDKSFIDNILGAKANAQSVTTGRDDGLKEATVKDNQIFWGNKAVGVDPISMGIYKTSKSGIDWFDNMIKSDSVTDKMIATSFIGMSVRTASEAGRMIGGGVMGLEAILQNPSGTEKAVISGFGPDSKINISAINDENTKLNSEIDSYNKDLATYNEKVKIINAGGGADDKTYKALNEEMANLEYRGEYLNIRSKDQGGVGPKSALGVTGGEIANASIDAMLFMGPIAVAGAERWAVGRGNLMDNPVSSKIRAYDVAEQIKMDNIRHEVYNSGVKQARAETVNQMLAEDTDTYGVNDLVTSGLRGEAQTKYITSKHMPDFWEMRGKSGIKGEVGDVEAYGVGKTVLYGDVSPEKLSKLSFNTGDMFTGDINLEKFSNSPASHVYDDKLFGHVKSTSPIKKYATNSKPMRNFFKDDTGSVILDIPVPQRTRTIKSGSELDGSWYTGKRSSTKVFSTSAELDAFTKPGFKIGVPAYNFNVASTSATGLLFRNASKNNLKNIVGIDKNIISDLTKARKSSYDTTIDNILGSSSKSDTLTNVLSGQKQGQKTATSIKNTQATTTVNKLLRTTTGTGIPSIPSIPPLKIGGGERSFSTSHKSSKKSGFKWLNDVDSWMDRAISGGKRKSKTNSRRRLF